MSKEKEEHATGIIPLRGKISDRIRGESKTGDPFTERSKNPPPKDEYVKDSEGRSLGTPNRKRK